MSLNLLQEHESARGTPSGPIGYEPSEDEQKSIDINDKIFNKSKNSRKPYDEKWLDYYRMFRGKQWKETRPSYRHSEVINLIFRAIQSDVPILTDAMPKPEFVPTEPNDFELSQILNDVLDSDWTYNNWSFVMTEIIYCSHFYGTGFGYVGYDAEASEGIGGVCFRLADTFYQYPDASASDVNSQRSRYYTEAEPMDVEILKHEYPDVSQFIKADLQELSAKDRQLQDVVRYRSPNDGKSIVESTSSFEIQTGNEALKITTYFHDLETVEEEINDVDEAGNENKKYLKKLKYPEGRKIVTASGILCEDCPIEFEDQKFPYVRLVNYIDPGSFFGISEVEQLESPQKIFNKLLSFTLDVLTLMGNPIWVVDTTSGIDTDNLFNRPGLIVEKEPNTEVRREEGVQLQPYVLQMIDRMKQWFDDISGSNDVSRGVKPEGVTAASAITALQDAAQTRLRQKTKNIDAFMQNFGQMYLSRVFQYYTAPRVFRITNDQNVMKYFKFHVDTEEITDPITGEPTGNQKKIARVRGYSEGVDGKHYEDAEEKRFDIVRRFDVKIATGSNLPFEKSRVEAQSYALFDRQIIDADEVLKNIRYPNADQVLQRMQQKAQAAAQAQAQGPQQAPPQGA